MRITEGQLRKIVRSEIKEAFGRSYTSTYGAYGRSGSSDRVSRIMNSMGIDREEAEQILTDVIDDVGHDPDAIDNAIADMLGVESGFDPFM